MNVRINKFAAGTTMMALILPGIAAAADANSILATVSGIINSLVPIILSLAIVFFLWGVLQYITKAGEEKGKAREQMLWGIIAIAVMVSIWGLVGVIRNTFQLQDNTPIAPNIFQTNGSVNSTTGH
jgi:hypothetical protein